MNKSRLRRHRGQDNLLNRRALWSHGVDQRYKLTCRDFGRYDMFKMLLVFYSDVIFMLSRFGPTSSAPVSDRAKRRGKSS